MFWIFIAVFLIILLWLWMAVPNLHRRRITLSKLQRKYAHRGIHNSIIPENTLPAFRKAKEEGCGIELDVRLTKDGKVVVFHDRNLMRSAGLNKNIDEISYNYLKNIQIFHSQEHIPLFSEVLEEFKDVPLLIELKGEVNGKELCPATAKLLDNYSGNYCIESFNPLILRWFKKNRPEIFRGQLSTRFNKDELSFPFRIFLTNLLSNHFAKPDFIAYDINHRHQLGYLIVRYLYRTPTLGWTIHPETKKLAEKRFDGIIYED